MSYAEYQARLLLAVFFSQELKKPAFQELSSLFLRFSPMQFFACGFSGLESNKGNIQFHGGSYFVLVERLTFRGGPGQGLELALLQNPSCNHLLELK